MDTRAKLFLIVAGVLLVGAVVGGLLVFEGSPLALGGKGEVTIVARITNAGPNEASTTLEASSLEGAGDARDEFVLASGETREFPLGTFEGQSFVHVKVTWSAGGFSGVGDRRALVGPDECDGTSTLTFVFRTEGGVTFDPTQRACA